MANSGEAMAGRTFNKPGNGFAIGDFIAAIVREVKVRRPHIIVMVGCLAHAVGAFAALLLKRGKDADVNAHILRHAFHGFQEIFVRWNLPPTATGPCDVTHNRPHSRKEAAHRP
jgi:hypothetical protein